MKKLMLVGVALLLAGPVMAARELTEKMTETEFAAKYEPHKEAGNKAIAEKRFEDARVEFLAAADATAFAWVRARMIANAAFAVIRATRLKEAIELYQAASKVQDVAEEVSSGGEKFAKDRAQCRADIEWGLARAQELSSKASK